MARATAKVPSTVQPLAATECSMMFAAEADRAQCARGAMAGFSLASLFAALHKSSTPLTFGKVDPKVVGKMYDAHPAPQCRLDTYFRGALCDKPVSEDVSNSDESSGSCGFTEKLWKAARPLCWYKAPGNPMIEPWFRKPPAPPVLPAPAVVQHRLESLEHALSGPGL